MTLKFHTLEHRGDNKPESRLSERDMLPYFPTAAQPVIQRIAEIRRGTPRIVLEGCGVLAAPLCGLYDLRIWVNTASQEGLARGVHPDIEKYGLDPERVWSAWTEWVQWESDSLAEDDRRLRADLTV